MKPTQFALAAVAAVLVAAPLSAFADAMGGRMDNSNSMPSGPSRADPVRAYQAGVAALQARNYPEAIRELRTARRGAPEDGLINYALGLAYVGATELDDARGAFERSARARNAPADAHRQLGLVYLQLNRRDDAVAQQTALARLVSECDAACGDARRAELQAAHDQLATALAPPAETPAAADPATTGWNFPSVEEGRAAFAEAIGLVNQERFADAFHVLTRAEAAVGPHPDVLNYMGFVSRKMGRYDAALGYYYAALAIDPDHLGANEYLGELFIQMGDMGRARTQLARLDEICAYGCEQREELARWIATAAE